MTISNLTYQERARFAYAAGNDELAEALEMCAELLQLTEEQEGTLIDVREEIEHRDNIIERLQAQIEELKEATE